MSKYLILVMFITFSTFSQTNIIKSIEWKGTKRMNTKFMTNFIETKVGSNLDTLVIKRDIAALTRLNGVSNVTYETKPISNSECDIFFTVIENFSILPNLNLWTTNEAAAAYRIGIYDYNFLGKNNTIGGFYQ